MSTVVANGQPHPVDITDDLDVHAGGVAGVAPRVGDCFLGDPMDRHADRRWQIVQQARQAHLDGRRLGGVGEPLDVRQAGLRGEVRLGSTRRTPTIVRISASALVAACSMVSSTASARSGWGAATARPAWAWMTMPDMW